MFFDVSFNSTRKDQFLASFRQVIARTLAQ